MATDAFRSPRSHFYPMEAAAATLHAEKTLMENTAGENMKIFNLHEPTAGVRTTKDKRDARPFSAVLIQLVLQP